MKESTHRWWLVCRVLFVRERAVSTAAMPVSSGFIPDECIGIARNTGLSTNNDTVAIKQYVGDPPASVSR